MIITDVNDEVPVFQNLPYRVDLSEVIDISDIYAAAHHFRRISHTCTLLCTDTAFMNYFLLSA